MNISTLPKYKTVSRPALLTLICLFSTFFCSAQYGVLDSTFGSGGKLKINIPGYGNNAYTVAVQADGKILVGEGISYSQGHLYTFIVNLTRYNTDGSIDASFGDNGIDTTLFISKYSNNIICSISIQSSGKIVEGLSGSDGLILRRYDANGGSDSTFGINGKAIYQGMYVYGTLDVKSMPDGSILIGGPGYPPLGGDGGYMLMRCDSIGALDGSFGKYGIVYEDNHIFSDDMINYPLNISMSIQCDGKIVAVGTTENSNISPLIAVSRFNPDGSPDQSFGTGGRVLTSFPYGDNVYARCVGLKSDGKIVVAGYLLTPRYDSCVIAQYLSDGSPDPSFGNGGVVEVNFPSKEPSYNWVQINSLIIQPDDKILIGGAGADNDYFDSYDINYFAVGRFNSDGTPDQSFGINGIVENNFGSATAMTMQADGKIIQVGNTASDSNIVLARYTSGLSNGPISNCQYPSFPFSEIPIGLFSVYPNPTSGNMTMQVSVTEQQNLNVQIYDTLGKPAMTISDEVNPGLSYYTYGVASLPTGNYIMKIQIGSQTYIKKLVKTE
jgi:uncharacterized delta-60 repeat protein